METFPIFVLKRIDLELHITQHIRYGLSPLPFGTLPLAASYMLGTIGNIGQKVIKLWRERYVSRCKNLGNT